jgi:hypothetical protein
MLFRPVHLHWDALTITLSVEGRTDLKNIVHFYSMRVTKFCTRRASHTPYFTTKYNALDEMISYT